jgi:amidase
MPQVVVDLDNGATVFETYLVRLYQPVLAEIIQMNRRKVELRSQMLKQWQDTASTTPTGRPIDAIICPAAPYAPPKHGEKGYFGYTGIYNLLDWPAMSIPVTYVDPVIDNVELDYTASNELDQKCRDIWDPVGSAGLPLGIQLVGQRWQEEKLLGVAAVLMKALGRT